MKRYNWGQWTDSNGGEHSINYDIDDMNENDKLTVQKIEYEIKIRTLLAQMAQLKTLENLGLQMA
jgi:hypothetical protein